MNGVSLGAAGSLLLFVAALGCGGHSAHDADDDGAGANAGDAAGTGGGVVANGGAAANGGSSTSGNGGSSGRSGPPTPAAVGLSISLSPAESTTVDFGPRSCPVGSTGILTYALGTPAPGGTLASGTSGATVSCTVTASGMVSAEVSGYDSATNERVALNFSAQLDQSANPMGLGSLQFYSPDTSALHVDTHFPACTVGPITTLKQGAVLAGFSCPILVADDDPMLGCAAEGTLALEYCLTGEAN